MGKSNTLSAAWLALVFQGTTITGIAQNVVSGAITTLWVALHTSDPGPGGLQNTNEAAYTGYARVGVVRTSSGWSLTGEEINPVANITFPTATGGSETETFCSIGTAQTGAGEILYSGPIVPPISVTPGVPPTLLTGTSVTES
jgi:hypothetical protein